MNDFVILGAGGHARVLLAALACRGLCPIGCLSPVPPPAPWPEGVVHLGGDAHLAMLTPARIQLVNGRGSVGSTSSRRRLYELAKDQRFKFMSVVHPAAVIDKGILAEEGLQVMAGAIVQGGVALGVNVLVNTGAVVDHDCRIGAHCHIATGARLSGEVELGVGVHIGTGASVIQGVRIGEEAIVGAGAVVVKDVPSGATVVGVPARVRHAVN